ncbi:SOS response-associated peptidase family protein [[Clostridium] aminophilum]|uniref:SOS response-associated peptidase family protein n=1 Tax=[Clostridium] aminophilum TaxID=1526 RepID=UPI0004E1D13C
MIHPISNVTWLCGLYQIKDGLPSFVILTKEAEKEIRFIHDRMLVILSEDLVSDWLIPDAASEQYVRQALTEMVVEKV